LPLLLQHLGGDPLQLVQDLWGQHLRARALLDEALDDLALQASDLARLR